MVLDSSAVVAIYLQESGYERLLKTIENSSVLFIGAPSVLESIMVLTTRTGIDSRPPVYALLHRISAEIVPFTNQHLEAAMTAFILFGKGRHPARLNFGDCMSYAFAALARMPLLFTGNDFTKTDITPA